MGRVLIAAAAAGLVASILTALVSGIPVPQIHDEFSYLLAADTYAHGRLTNPPHPLWPWFETFHVLMRPTYMSKYPPAQGAFLALGLLAGLPIAGVWLSTALACAAVAWMLLAWLPPRWALAGAVLAAFHPAMLGWTHSYWGAGVPVLGGALVVGAAGRLVEGCRLPVSGCLGLGVVLLANSRPWEGGVLVLALCAVAATMRLLRWRCLVPAIVVVALGGAFMLYDNWRVTGRPLLLPYALYERQYGFTPPLVWQKSRPVALPAQMRRVAVERDYGFYRERRTPLGFLASVPKTLAVYVNGALQFIPDALLVRLPHPRLGLVLSALATALELPLLAPLLLLPGAMRKDRALCALVIAGAIAAAVALLPAVVPLPHYAGPFVPLLVLLWLVSVREAMERLGRPRAVAVAVAAMWLFGAAFWFVESRPWRYRWDEVAYRLAVERTFRAKPGRHLLVVRYAGSHNPHFEWVQNGADIDDADIIWAHDLGDNAPLLRRFRDRDAWLVTVSAWEAKTARLR